MAIKEIQIHQLPEVDKITNENVFAVEVGTTTYKVTGQTLINFIKTHSEIKNIYIDKELIGVNNGIVPINSDGKIDSQYISYGNVSGTSYEGSSGKLLEDELTAHKQDSSNPHGVDKEQVGLGNVENKSSEDIRGELTFDNVTKALGFTPEIDGSYENSVAYTDKAIADLIGGAEEDLNTLKELSDAIKESKSVVEALNEAIGKKANEAEFDSHVKDTAVHLSSTDRENITTSLEHAKSDHARSDATKAERSTTNGNIKINGTETAVYQHPISGVTAGTYRQVTVDSQGHITGGNNTTLPLTQGGTGATTAAQALSNLGISATAEELNKLDGATVSVTEINQLKGVISPIQEQLNGKAPVSHGNHVPDVTDESSGSVMMSDGTNYEWKKLEKQDIVDALGYVPGTGSIVYTSVKGDAETEYRTGEVNITKDNIGLGKVDNTSDNEKSVLSASKLSNVRKIGNASFDGTKDITLKETGALDPIGDEFNSSLTYVVGDFCIYNNALYKCTTAIDTAGEWDESKWEVTTVTTELSNTNGNLRSSLDTTLKGKIINGTLTASSSSVSTLPYKFIIGSAVVLNNEIHILGSAYDSRDTNNYTKHYKWDGTSWTEVSTLPYNFYGASAVVLNNEIHILGSGPDSSDTTNYTKHYKWDGTSWISVSTLPYIFSNGSAVVLNNEIHILGCGDDIPNKHYKWNGTSWTSVSTLPYNFIAGSAVVYNNEIHILGGGVDSSTYTKHYKWNGTSWTEVSTLPYAFYQSSAVVYNNEIHILGSANNSDTTNYTKHYKWNGTSWTSISALPYNFYGGSAVVYNNEIHIFGGADNNTSSDIFTNHYKIDTGQSTLTLTDSAIKEDSILDIYVSQYGVSPTSVTSEVGSVTLTFGKLDNDLNVKVVIM